ncbi:2-methoxy-6-polyprenyl-14-benzoquinol methylase mitochondrial [Zea mays]|uniref:2-methoxy-6-polyprenyl-14-benzoquinol methylase mitochondrial n=1 Tax=Zea mays TaxID=4577 RepID=A0A1D6KGH3_MAIZE|nr:2-methoxy-6-polyprenyl-14-benzoquinol methylase mitochondrial [Zea mays]
MKSLSKSTCVREVLSTCADQSYLGILLNCCLCCSLASILHTPSNESCAKFFEALVLALEELHQSFLFLSQHHPGALEAGSNQQRRLT